MICRRTNSSILIGVTPWGICVAVLAIMMPATGSFAQARASADVQGIALERNRHPVMYLWDEEDDPDAEQIPPTDPSHYYTFFYTGTVLDDGTVPIGTPIRRIAIALEEWEANKAEIILSLATFYDEAYQTGMDSSARKSLVNKNVALDANFNYVDTTPPEEKKVASVDPMVAAEWSFYYDQLALWSFYCRRTVLNDPSSFEGLRSISSIERRENIEAVREYKKRDDLDVEDLDSAKILKAIEKQQFVDRGGLESNFDSDEASKAVPENAVYDPWADWNDPARNEMFREDFEVMAEEREELALIVMNEMLTNIAQREVERDRYAKWKTQGRENLDDFLEAWSKVRSGERVTFEDVFYLISDEPIESVPSDARNIVKRKQLTPQDLIDANGNLKGSEFDQGE